MLRQYATSFLFGSLYKLSTDIYNIDGVRENIPITISEMINALGYTFLTYLSTNNCNLPITLSAAYIIYKKILKNIEKNNDIPTDDAKVISEIIEIVKDKTFDILNKNTDENSSYPSHITQYIQHYGDSIINSIQLRKKPVLGIYNKLLYFLTLGQIDNVKKILNTENFNHTSMIIGFIYNDTQRYILLEKQNRVTILEQFTTDPSLLYKNIENISDKNLSLKKFMENGRCSLGENLNTYHIFKNNCQHFLQKILEANDLLNDEITEFINQKTEIINDRINLFANSVIIEMTNITFILLLFLSVLNFSYSQFNPFSIILNLIFYSSLIVIYEEFFSKKTTIIKIAGSIGIFLLLICSLFVNFFFKNEYLQVELLLFSIAYLLISIGSMVTKISKDVILEIINKNITLDLSIKQ
jgi:hypothetical protein